MFIWWGRRLRTRRLETGHFDCPHRRSHQPCVLVQLERMLMLYSFIPIAGGEEVARYIECQSCRTHQDAALFAAPSGEGAFVRETWECPQCHNANLNTLYKCRRCGFAVA
jgi:hypothetical protein